MSVTEKITLCIKNDTIRVSRVKNKSFSYLVNTQYIKRQPEIREIQIQAQILNKPKIFRMT